VNKTFNIIIILLIIQLIHQNLLIFCQNSKLLSFFEYSAVLDIFEEKRIMLKSMTGFGKAIKEYKEKKITVEIKSLNSKQSDINIKLPVHFREKELLLRNEINQNLNRGKIDLSVWIDGSENGKNIQFNEPLILEYYRQLDKISKKLGRTLDDEQVLHMIMRLPDVLKTETQTVDENEWDVIFETVQEALVQLNQFRLQEGNVLEQDFIMRIDIISNLLTKIEPFENERIIKIRERINQNLQETIETKQIDNNRLEQEIILYVEKLDITEEKIRLKNHCSYFIETMQKEEFAGKKLGFIVQEIGREINTIGSKANHVEIQKVVVQMKDELEKIKEQLLNIL
jgi:uncharacterized protein (TIGR00255 family)